MVDKDDDDAELPQKKSKICNSDEIVVMDVSDLANDDDQEKPKEGTTSRPTTPSPIDIVQVEGRFILFKKYSINR